MRKIVVPFLLAASLFAFSCKDDPNRPPASDGTGSTPPLAGGGGGGGGDGGGEAGSTDASDDADGGSCTTLENEGAVVDQNRVVGDPQTGTGGTVADGTYELTEAQLYVGAAGTPGPSGVTYQGALRITGGTQIERVMEITNPGSQPVETRTIGLMTATGTTFTVSQSCPTPFQDQYTYSVVTNTLVLTSLLTKESYTFTLR